MSTTLIDTHVLTRRWRGVQLTGGQ